MSNMEWLMGLGSLGMRLGLENMSELMRILGDPVSRYRTVHVAGTDGKGSTCTMLRFILSEKMRAGLYVSPHVERINERISVDGTDISDEDIERIAGIVRKAWEHLRKEGKECTFFEVVTAIASVHFMEKNVDIAIIETGLGGRFDATNIITPDVSVITHIGLEHTSILGDTVEKIAFEKSGIIKPGIPVVTANEGKAYDVIEKIAKERGSKIIQVRKDNIKNVSIDRSGTSMVYDGIPYRIGIAGRHQAENAAVAIETVRESNVGVPDDMIQNGLDNARIKGRMEFVNGIMFDVTHTSEGSKRLADDVRHLFGNVILVFGLLDDKDMRAMSENLSNIADKVIVTSPDTERAADPVKLLDVMKEFHKDVEMCDSVGNAMERALKERKNGELILVTGSFHMVEEGMKWLRTYAGS